MNAHTKKVNEIAVRSSSGEKRERKFSRGHKIIERVSIWVSLCENPQALTVKKKERQKINIKKGKENNKT